jgi:hypothetical protein
VAEGRSDALHLIALVVAILAFAVLFIVAQPWRFGDSLSQLAGWAGLGVAAWLASKA